MSINYTPKSVSDCSEVDFQMLNLLLQTGPCSAGRLGVDFWGKKPTMKNFRELCLPAGRILRRLSAVGLAEKTHLGWGLTTAGRELARYRVAGSTTEISPQATTNQISVEALPPPSQLVPEVAEVEAEADVARRTPHRVGDIWRHTAHGQRKVAQVGRIGNDTIIVFENGFGGGSLSFLRLCGFRRVAYAEASL